MDKIKKSKSSTPDVLIAFVLLLLLMGFIFFTQDLSMFIDRQAEIDGYGEYVHEYEESLIDFKPEAITAFFAFLPDKQAQIIFQYGQFYGVGLDSDCIEEDDWMSRVSSPPRQLDVPEENIDRIMELYAILNPSYVVDQTRELSDFGLNDPVGCVYVEVKTESYQLLIGQKDVNVDYRYVSLKNESTIYAIPGEYFNLLEEIEF